jgi:uncharacterized phiE125 gp8 family phage protein
MPLTVDTAPISDPVDLEELKSHLNLDGSTHWDDYLPILIGAVVKPAQEALGLQLMKATLVWTMKEWKQKSELPHPPLMEVSKVEYRDTDGEWQTVDTFNYEVNSDAKPGFVRFSNGYEAPQVCSNEVYPWRFTYSAGYGTSSEKVPLELRLWMMNIIGSLFMKREDMLIGSADVVYLQKAMARLIKGHNANFRFG